MKRKIALILTAAMLVVSMAGCQKTEKTEKKDAEITKDLAGNEIVLPESTDKIMSLASSCTDIIAGLGAADSLIAIDKYSAAIEGVPQDLMQFDMMKPDTEQIIAQGADVVFVTSMSNAGGDDVFKPVRDAGICVVAIPSASSIEEIEKSIRFIGDVLGRDKDAESLVMDMETEIDRVKEISSKITDKKKVYFEIGAEPKLYTFGTNTFLNEMLTLIGAENIFADQAEWITVSEESVVNANPDVILTNVGYSEHPVEDVLNRNGWESVNAVKEEQVYFINQNASSLPTQNIIVALKEMAEAVYPEFYKE